MSTPSVTAGRAAEAGAEKSDRFPAGIPYIVGNEGAERFSYYGMRSILYVYMTSVFLGFVAESAAEPTALADAKTRATQVTHLFMAGVYAFPMIGAILADRWLGKFRVIMWLSLVYCAGHAALAVAGRLGAMGDARSTELWMYGGLALIALGSGGIKPCVSANVGDQFTAENGHLVSKVFQIFYFIINFGSFFATLLIPQLYRSYGAEVAFGLPGVLMAIATLVFWLGRHTFVRVPPRPGGRLGALDFASAVLLFFPVAAILFIRDLFPSPALLAVLSVASLALGLVLFSRRQAIEPDSGFLAVLVYAIRNQKDRKPGEGFFSVARGRFGEEAAEGPPAVLRIMLVFSMVSFFWALFEQHSSTWIEQAKQMDLSMTMPYWVGRWALYGTIGLAAFGLLWLMLWVSNVRVPKAVSFAIGGLVGAGGIAAVAAHLAGPAYTTFALQASQMAALNPLMVMMIIPLLNVALYRPLEKRGRPLKPLQKMTIGMFLAAAAFALAALLQVRIEQGEEKVHVLWQVAQYWTITTSEVLVSVTGLEFAYTQAPRRMKSTIMGFWLLCVTFGNVLVALLAPLQKLSLSLFFWVFAGLMAAASVVFAILAYFYKGKTYLQQAGGH